MWYQFGQAYRQQPARAIEPNRGEARAAFASGKRRCPSKLRKRRKDIWVFEAKGVSTLGIAQHPFPKGRCRKEARGKGRQVCVHPSNPTCHEDTWGWGTGPTREWFCYCQIGRLCRNGRFAECQFDAMRRKPRATDQCRGGASVHNQRGLGLVGRRTDFSNSRRLPTVSFYCVCRPRLYLFS